MNGHARTLKFDPRNARLHGDRNKQVIRQSLQEVGAFRSIAVDGENIVRAGNGVLEQAQGLGIKVKVVDAKPDELIAVRRKDLRGKLAERAAILDNRAGELAEWDPQVIADLAQSNPAALEGLWSQRELKDLLSALLDAEREEKVSDVELLERANELQRKWQVKRGDIWQVPSLITRGKAHRILCGDALSIQDLTKLLNGTQAALSFTSPPYWVGKEFERQRTIQEIESFIQQAAASMARAVRRDASRIVINTGTGFTTSFAKHKKRHTLLLIDKWSNALFAQGWNLRHIRHWLKSGQADHPLSPASDLIDQHSEFLGTFEHDQGKPIQFDDLLSETEVGILETFYHAEGKQRGQERVGKSANKWIFKSYGMIFAASPDNTGIPLPFPSSSRRGTFCFTPRRRSP
ncbi:MAG TPA: hypothetical protein VFD70_05655 [Anaerolineae bacterium]|nr:hypothetical protein [Anaerolineae bacterium]